MNDIGQPERATQHRVIALFRDELGYRFLGNWTDRAATATSRTRCSHLGCRNPATHPIRLASAIYLLRTEADNHNRSLYDNNQAVYKLLRYGVHVKTEAGKVTDNVVDRLA